ncbi:MAG: enoyl-CoA hydratase/isomerase family protein [Bdellovibrio sp.]|nr:enoyl-CoA hydratase/isomerase family protein [Bdellovibrio sp.]
MAYENIKVEKKFDGQISEISLNTPPANILTSKMLREISEALAQEEKDQKIKLIIFSAQEKNFSYGASVEEHLPAKVSEMLPVFHKLIGQVIKCPTPTLAQVRGLCLGGGFELALACNFIFTDTTAKFSVPEITLGVFPPVACALLPSCIGQAFASQFVLTGDKLTAKDLLDFKLAHTVVEPNLLELTTHAFIKQQILPKSASSLRMANRALRSSIIDQYDKYIVKLEKLYLEELMKTEDAKEGVKAFIEKRPPNWKNA